MCRRSVAHSNKSGLRYDPYDYSNFEILTNIRVHYLEDLQPYICLHNGCSSRDTRYSTIDEWTSHIRTSHGQAWQCLFGCNELFHVRTRFEGHMIAEHHAQFTSEELPTLTELCMKHTLATVTTCPCCDTSINDSDHLHLHVAKHLEDIAILSLMPNLPCKVSANADPDLQPVDTITSHAERESPVQTAGPIQQVVRGRTDTCEGPPGRARSAPCWEREPGKSFKENIPLGGIGDEPFSSQGFRRHSWDNLPKTAEILAIDLDYPGPRRSEEDAVAAATTSSSARGAHESTSLVDPSILESSAVHDGQDYSLENDPKTFEIDVDDVKTIFSLEPGYQDFKVSNDDGGPVCVVKFDSTIAAFRAAYKLNHCLLPSSNATRLSIDFSGRTLSVRVVSGPPLDTPLLEAVEQYPLSDSIIPFSHHGGLKQYQDYEQTDHASWETTTYA